MYMARDPSGRMGETSCSCRKPENNSGPTNEAVKYKNVKKIHKCHI
jgi:hypothetical protein